MVAVNKTKNQIRVLMTNVLTSSGRFILFHYPHPQGEGEEGLHPTGVKGDHKAKPVPVRRKKGASSMCIYIYIYMSIHIITIIIALLK